MEGKGSALAIPHSLALIEEEDILCIADREHRRVLCINAGLSNPGQFGEIVSVTNGVDVGRVFGITYASMWAFSIYNLVTFGRNLIIKQTFVDDMHFIFQMESCMV